MALSPSPAWLMIGAAIHPRAKVGGMAVGIAAGAVDVAERAVGGDAGPDAEARLLVNLADLVRGPAVLRCSAQDADALERGLRFIPFDGWIFDRLGVEIATELDAKFPFGVDSAHFA